MRWAWLVSIGCFAAQAAAYSKSALTAGGPTHCIVWPFGACETIVASGWAALLGGAGREYNLEAAVATFMPLFMVYTLVLSMHNPSFTMHRGEYRKISPVGWMYIAALVAIVGVSALTLRQLPVPERVGSLTALMR